uniref:DUF834 domain-containing protein n=1 Tax=Oryza glaberrima TaxID=4538 RepID=I1PDA7_ORYGL
MDEDEDNGRGAADAGEDDEMDAGDNGGRDMGDEARMVATARRMRVRTTQAVGLDENHSGGSSGRRGRGPPPRRSRWARAAAKADVGDGDSGHGG